MYCIYPICYVQVCILATNRNHYIFFFFSVPVLGYRKHWRNHHYFLPYITSEIKHISKYIKLCRLICFESSKDREVAMLD